MGRPEITLSVYTSPEIFIYRPPLSGSKRRVSPEPGRSTQHPRAKKSAVPPKIIADNYAPLAHDGTRSKKEPERTAHRRCIFQTHRKETVRRPHPPSTTPPPPRRNKKLGILFGL